MNKTRLLLLSALGVTLVAGAVAFVALRGSSDAYANVLPNDATAIARLDAKAFLRDADLSVKDVIQLLRSSQDSDDAPRIGVDVKHPVYLFASSSNNMGAVFAVDDEDDLIAFCESRQAEGHASEITPQRGYSWVVVEQQWLLAFDAKKALVMGPAVGAAQDQLRNEMARLLEQKREDSGLETPLFDALSKSDEPLVAVVAPEVLPAEARQVLRRFKVSSRADALLRLTVETDDNELELEANVLAESDGVKDELKRMDDVLRPIKGSLTEHTHAENVAWIAMNVDGSMLLDALRSDATVRTALLALNLAFDLDRIIRSVDGDFAMELTEAASLGGNARNDSPFNSLYVTAVVSNTDFLNDASTWGNSLIGVQALTPQDFVLNLGSGSLYFGVEGKTFYLGGEQGLVHEENSYLHQRRNDIKGNRFFATFTVPALVDQLDMKSELSAALSNFERLNLEMEHVGDVKMQLVAPRGTNIAREILLSR